MEEIIVNVQQGALKGKTDIDYNGRPYFAFLGIPYAKPPLEKLRFKAPLPVEQWSGIRDATSDGSPCYSREFILRTIVGSEDCLYLNVYSPELPKGTPILKPVMVYIHGGAFVAGSNSSLMYGPQFLLTGDVVLVVINYRLGLLGFLAFDDPTLGVPGNAGCKDMVMALKWVQSNIAAFGGDPCNVTIFGESAGGGAVHFLVLSPMARGLFHKAVIQSGSALNPWSLARPSVSQLVEILKCHYTKEEDVLSYLQELPVQKILEAQNSMPDEFYAGFVRSIGPTIEKSTNDGEHFLTEDPLDMILQGNYNHVPLVFGYNAREGIFYEALARTRNISVIIEDFEDVIPHTFKLTKGSHSSKAISDKIKQFYHVNAVTSDEMKEIMCLIHSDTIFIHGIYSSAKYHAISSKEPVYLYRFSLDAGLNFYKKFVGLKLPGASHADELGYLFKTFLTPKDLDPDGIESKTVRRIVELWTNFAKTGNPNPVDNVLWNTVSKDKLTFLDIGDELTSGVDPDADRMKFWDEISQTAK